MGFEIGAITVGGVSIITILVTELKCDAKKTDRVVTGAGSWISH